MSAKVGLLMGSNSDLPKIQGCIDTLKNLGIECEVRVMSAHRTPDLVAEYATNAAGKDHIRLPIFAAKTDAKIHLITSTIYPSHIPTNKKHINRIILLNPIFA